MHFWGDLIYLFFQIPIMKKQQTFGKEINSCGFSPLVIIQLPVDADCEGENIQDQIEKHFMGGSEVESFDYNIFYKWDINVIAGDDGADYL